MNDFDENDFLQMYAAELEEIKNRNDDDYEINPKQWAKLMSVMALFYKLASRFDTITPVDLQPKRQVGDVIVDFLVLSLDISTIPQFCQALSYASAVVFESRDSDDGLSRVHIEIVIPNVFVKK